jgi:hypothetical protein
MRLFLLLAGLMAATPALAQQTPPAPPAAMPGARPGQPTATIIAEPVALLIAAFDADHDARVTRAEFDAGLKASWAGPSVGYIGYADWALTWLGDRNALPNPFEIDRDGDNRITFDELVQRFDLFFTRFDADRDGAIARSELLTVRTAAGMTPGLERRRGRREPPPAQ